MGSMSLVTKNTIYVVNYGSEDDIVWVSEKDYHGDLLDKQYTGQYYTEEQVTAYFKESISLEEAVSRNLIKCLRFRRMGSSDKTDTIKTMLKVKGLLETLNFLCETKLNLSNEDLKSLLNG